MGDYLPTVSLGSGVLVNDVGLGNKWTVILTSERKMKGVGNNNFGQLGYGHNENIGDIVNETGEYIPYINLGSTEEIITQTSSGDWHTCVVFGDGSLIKCWYDIAQNKPLIIYHIGVIIGLENLGMGIIQKGEMMKTRWGTTSPLWTWELMLLFPS